MIDDRQINAVGDYSVRAACGARQVDGEWKPRQLAEVLAGPAIQDSPHTFVVGRNGYEKEINCSQLLPTLGAGVGRL